MKLSQELGNNQNLRSDLQPLSEDTQRLDKIFDLLARGMFSQIELEDYQIYHAEDTFEVQFSPGFEDIQFIKFKTGREAIDFVLTHVEQDNE